MKWILLLAVLVMLVAPVVATQIDFQEVSDLEQLNGTYTWDKNTTSGNMYITTSSSTGLVFLATASQTTYAAATCFNMPASGNGGARMRLLSSAYTDMGGWNLRSSDTNMSATGRWEVIISGTSASLYVNGKYISSVTTSSNPYHVGIGTYTYVAAQSSSWDDYVYGTEEDTTIISGPEDAAYYIKKDMVNPASSGLFNATTGIVTSSSQFPFGFARSNLSGEAYYNNDSIYLINAQSGTVYATQYTGTSVFSGSSLFTKSFDINTALITSDAPYGWYQIKINNTLSSTRWAYIANGANIYFDADEYSQGDSATVTYLVDSEYWLPGEYTYRIDVIDVYGTVHHTENIATSEGSVSFTWDADEDDQGVYYAEIIADRISDGEDILMNYDYATLTAYFGFTGYVNAAQTALPIEAANVTYAQGDTVETDSSGFDGNYSVSGFLTGIPIWANVSADGYETQNFTFTVMNGHTITRNITLNETTPSYTGLGIGGVCRDGVFTSPNSITGGYGRPIPSATCYLLNTTHSESYNTTGNNAGGYLFDESGPVFLTSGRVYDLWCERSGYSNSPNYTVVAA